MADHQWQDSPMTGLRLLWHVCQLLNMTTSGISTWLSLEALNRDLTHAQGISVQHTDNYGYGYKLGLMNHSTMLIYLTSNLSDAVSALKNKPEHLRFVFRQPYLDLLKAVERTEEILGAIPRDGKLPNADQVQLVCDGHRELSVLCHGSIDNVIEGWAGCWAMINDYGGYSGPDLRVDEKLNPIDDQTGELGHFYK